MIRGAGNPVHKVRYRPGEVRAPRRGKRVRGARQFFVGITRTAYWAGLSILIVYAIYQSYVLFFETDWFKIEEVEVRGNQVLQQQQILSLSRIELGSHFLRYKPEDIRGRILAHPRILESRVSQVSPRKIRIEVVENRPVVNILVEGDLYEVGEDGSILGPANPATTLLPLVVGLPMTAPDEMTGAPRVDPEAFAVIPAWLQALQKSFLSNFDHIDFTNPYRVEVHWSGVRILMSEPTDVLNMSNTALRTLQDAVDRNIGIYTMDLRFRTLVVKYSSEPRTGLTTWAIMAAAPPPVTEAASPTPVATVLSPGDVLTSHPAVLAAASSQTPEFEAQSARFTDEELAALEAASVPAADLGEAAKPAFVEADEVAEWDVAPDSAYIYNPPPPSNQGSTGEEGSFSRRLLERLATRGVHLEVPKDGHQ